MRLTSSFRAPAIRVAGLLSLLLAAACQQAPVTGRDQLVLVPEAQAVALGADAYRDILRQTRQSRNPTYTDMVERVGRRIAAVADDPGYRWEFAVIEDDTPNAFVLPGGKVGVHTGLFRVAETEAQLAAVLAHEVGHAVARHSAEMMTRQLLVEGGLTAIGMSAEGAVRYRDLLAQAATLGAILPFSRAQEAEADEIGLRYMAMAGYDPRQAVALWRNFAREGGSRPPEFLSTHPLPSGRIERLEALMPGALEIYRNAVQGN